MTFDASIADAIITPWLPRGKRSRIADSLPWRRQAQPTSAAEYIKIKEERRRAREEQEP